MRGPSPSRSRSHSRVFNSADIDAKLNAITSSPLLQEQRGAIVMPVYLKSLSLENYRGIGEQQLMTKFQNFNFFIGPNNSGKSIILNFISNYIPLRKGSSRSQNWEEIRGLETHGGIYGGAVQVRIGFPTGEILQKFFERHPYLDVGRFQDTIISTFNAISHEQHLWLDCSLPFIGRHFEILYNIDHLFGLNPAHIWSEIHNLIRTNGQSISSPYDNSHQDIRNNKIPDIISRIKSCMEIDNLPETQLIPAIRQIGPTGARFADFSGAGLIDQLALIQNPDHNHQQDRDLFDKINTFLQSVTDRHDARIEIPNSKAHVLVRMDGRVLPLHSLGTGIQEVVMIAAFCTIAQEQIICVEEPELHLHPLLQRKLIRYLKENTNNQYFIATHSAAFIDTPGAEIFHVKQELGLTKIKSASLNKDLHAICADLGHRASDIIQSNAVLWVEGPSDRIYLKHWISLLNPNLLEGIHYSVMFYGGRLLSHLSGDDDDDVHEFIQLRALNRNLAVMIDSDKRTARTPLNPTKTRLSDEFARQGGIAWITKGREVENYIDFDLLQAAVKAVHSATYQGPVSGTQYDHALYYKRKAKKGVAIEGDTLSIETNVDKVKVARHVVMSGDVTLNPLDLRKRIREIVTMIENANS